MSSQCSWLARTEGLLPSKVLRIRATACEEFTLARELLAQV
jgi:hypothetical protein